MRRDLRRLEIRHHSHCVIMGSLMAPGTEAFIGIMGFWLIFTVFGNFCVILVVVRNKKMRTVTNIFICNLALSDIFLAAVVLPQNLHDMSHTGDFHEGMHIFNIY